MERNDDEMDPVMSEGEGEYNDNDMDDLDNCDDRASSLKESQDGGEMERAVQQALIRQAEHMQSLMGLSNFAGFQNFAQFPGGFGSSLGMLQAQIQALNGQPRHANDTHSGIATPATSPFVSTRNNSSPKRNKDRPKEGSDSSSPQRLSSSSNSSFPAFPGLVTTAPHPPLTPSPSSDSPPQQEGASRVANQQSWTFEEQFKQLYELSDDVGRKLFLDDLFDFMQKRGTPITRLPIMAKQVLDLYELYNLVVARGGLVDVINKKLWQEIIKGLHLPSSITSAAFTLRTQYMKYLYPYECEKEKFSSASELQAAIDGNRREGRRSGYAPYGDVAPRGNASLGALASHLSSPMSLMSRATVNGTSVTPGSSSPPAGSTQDALAALDMSQRLHLWNLYSSLGDMGGDMAAAMAAAARFLPPQTEALNLAAEQQAAAAAAAAAAATRAQETPKYSAAKERRYRRDEERETKPARIKEENVNMDEPSSKKVLLDEDIHQNSNPPSVGSAGANIKISSRGGDGRSKDNSLVVSMEINGTVYQGVLFAQAEAAAEDLGEAMRSRVA